MLPSGERGSNTSSQVLNLGRGGNGDRDRASATSESGRRDLSTCDHGHVAVDVAAHASAAVVPAAAILHVLRNAGCFDAGECTIKGRRTRACSKRKTIA